MVLMGKLLGMLMLAKLTLILSLLNWNTYYAIADTDFFYKNYIIVLLHHKYDHITCFYRQKHWSYIIISHWSVIVLLNHRPRVRIDIKL